MEMCFVCFAATQRATDLEFLLGGPAHFRETARSTTMRVVRFLKLPSRTVHPTDRNGKHGGIYYCASEALPIAALRRCWVTDQCRRYCVI